MVDLSLVNQYHTEPTRNLSNHRGRVRDTNELVGSVTPCLTHLHIVNGELSFEAVALAEIPLFVDFVSDLYSVCGEEAQVAGLHGLEVVQGRGYAEQRQRRSALVRQRNLDLHVVGREQPLRTTPQTAKQPFVIHSPYQFYSRVGL